MSDIKKMHEMIEMLVGCAKAEFDKQGIEQVDTKEMGEVFDMIKDLAEAQYYRTLTVAMEESEYGEDYDENGPMEERRYYRGQRRDSRGRYMSRRRGYEEMMPYYDDMEHMRDMDYGMGRMYYTSGGSGSSSGNASGGSTVGMNSGGSSRNYGGERDYREGRSGMKRRGYMETKEMHQGNTAEDKQKKMKELEDYMTELGSDISEMISGASNEEKTMLKTKLQTMAQKIS